MVCKLTYDDSFVLTIPYPIKQSNIGSNNVLFTSHFNHLLLYV